MPALSKRGRILDRLDLVQRHRLPAGFSTQQVAQRRHRALVDQLRAKLLVVSYSAGARGGLQRGHHVGVEGVVLAAVHVLEQPALAMAGARSQARRASRRWSWSQILESRRPGCG
jgi:hypothetical protein